MRALVDVYNLSYPLAIVLSTVGVVFCGSWRRGTLDLHELSRHGQIEHDVSTVHEDAAPGAQFAPCCPSRPLLSQLLSTASGVVMRLDDFVHARIKRANMACKSIDSVHKEIAHGESALTLLVLGKGKPQCEDTDLVVPKDFVEQWYGDERLPEEWERPTKPVGLLRTVRLSQTVALRIDTHDWVKRSA